jgi:type IV secretory pathway TrbD component
MLPAAFGVVIAVVAFGFLIWMAIDNPVWRGSHARVLSLSVLVPIAVVMVFVGLMLVVS